MVKLLRQFDIRQDIVDLTELVHCARNGYICVSVVSWACHMPNSKSIRLTLKIMLIGTWMLSVNTLVED